MELVRIRCDDDDPTIIIAQQVGETVDGSIIEVGQAEIASAIAIDSSVQTLTLAVRNGVTGDFQLRTALGLSNMRILDPHGLCPLIGIIAATWAILAGSEVIRTSELLSLKLSDDTPDWIKVLVQDTLGKEKGTV